jgi:hypothetical protein
MWKLLILILMPSLIMANEGQVVRDTITWYEIQELAKTRVNGSLAIKDKVVVRGKSYHNHNDPVEFFSRGRLISLYALNISNLKRLTFQNCVLKGLRISNTDLRRFKVSKCSGASVLLLNSSIDNIDLIKSTIHAFSLFDIASEEIRLDKNSIFDFSLNRSKVNLQLLVDSCDFATSQRRYGVALYDSEVDACTLVDCSFPESTENTNNLYAAIRCINTKINTLNLLSSSLTGLVFNNSGIAQSLSMKDVIISDYLAAERFSMPNENTNLDWSLISDTKLAILVNDTILIRNRLGTDFTNKYAYDGLVNLYNQFYRLYKTRGDRASANSCLVEMKDLETKRLKLLMESNNDFESAASYYLNVFLKYFAKYGTSPMRSLQISMWVVLWFAFIFFFIYSDWDRINRHFFMEKSNTMINYFSSEQNLEDFYSESSKSQFNSFEKFKINLNDKKSELPFLFAILLKPLYSLALAKYKFNTWLYRRLEILQGRWTDLSGGRKFLVGTSLTVMTIIYLSYLVLLRGMNSIMLSVNTFSTLGFGDIPVTGIGRYLAIIEGFLGWFLLSIFSVSLISQILQS